MKLSRTIATTKTTAGGARRRRGFTLTELLIVISVVVLMLAMAVPLFRVMSGDRSIEGAQNITSAMLQRARARAIGMQSPRGVFFFEDQATKKTAMLLVRIDAAGLAPNTNANVIDIDEEGDEMQLLPQGVGVAFVLGRDPSSTVVTAPGAVPPTTMYKPFGLVAFDGMGRFMPITSYMTSVTANAEAKKRYPPDGITQLYTRLRDNIGEDAIRNLGTNANGYPTEFSHPALMLYDKSLFSQLKTGPNPAVFDKEQSDWLDNNGLVLAINRYTGTFLKGE